MILLAGDCTGSAYLFAPSSERLPALHEDDHHEHHREHDHNNHHDHVKSKSSQRKGMHRGIPAYELAFEVDCGSTVGSIAVSPGHNKGEMNVYIPSYEFDKVHVLSLTGLDKWTHE